MTKKLEQVTNLINMITGLTGVLAGGCVRDTLMAREPKDYDFLVEDHDSTDMEVLLQMIEEQGGVIHKTMGDCSFCQEPPQHDGNNFLTRFKGGVSFTFLDYHIEILFCQHSIKKTIELFDCNLNQVYFSIDEGIVGALPDALEFKSWVPEERRDYIERKFNTYKIAQNLEQH